MNYNGIIIFGEMGSGKDTLADFIIEEDKRIKKYGLGDIIRTIKPVSIVDPMWFGNERTLYQTFADKLREINYDILNEYALGKMIQENFNGKPIITKENYDEDLKNIFEKMRNESNFIPMIVGGRTFSDYDYWKKRNFFVVGITMEKENRISRLIARDGEEVAKKSDSTHNTEKDVRDIIEKADIKVNNDGTLEDLREEAKKVLSMI